jgi:hypothetical protein
MLCREGTDLEQGGIRREKLSRERYLMRRNLDRMESGHGFINAPRKYLGNVIYHEVQLS